MDVLNRFGFLIQLHFIPQLNFEEENGTIDNNRKEKGCVGSGGGGGGGGGVWPTFGMEVSDIEQRESLGWWWLLLRWWQRQLHILCRGHLHHDPKGKILWCSKRYQLWQLRNLQCRCFCHLIQKNILEYRKQNQWRWCQRYMQNIQHGHLHWQQKGKMMWWCWQKQRCLNLWRQLHLFCRWLNKRRLCIIQNGNLHHQPQRKGCRVSGGSGGRCATFSTSI